MATDNRTPNRNYRLPHPGNLMRSEEVPRFIQTFEMIDADMAEVFLEVAGKAPELHEHEMGAIIGLLGALSGKAAFVHNHSIGSLLGVDFSGATTNQFAKFNGSLWIPAFIQAADLANKIITNAKLRDSDPLTVMGRALASLGPPGDISATANDTFLRRVGDALGFGKLTEGMVPPGLLTFAMLASAAIATKAQAEAGAANDVLMTALRTKEAIAAATSGASGFSVRQAGGQTLGAATATKVAFDTVIRSTNWNAANNRWIPPAGPVFMSASVTLLTGTVSREIFIYKNGSICTRVNSGGVTGTTGTNISVGLYDDANGTDYYEVYMMTNTTGGGIPGNGATFAGIAL